LGDWVEGFNTGSCPYTGTPDSTGATWKCYQALDDGGNCSPPSEINLTWTTGGANGSGTDYTTSDRATVTLIGAPDTEVRVDDAVISWLDGTRSNYGWKVWFANCTPGIGSVSAATHASDDDSDSDDRPALTIYYTESASESAPGRRRKMMQGMN